MSRTPTLTAAHRRLKAAYQLNRIPWVPEMAELPVVTAIETAAYWERRAVPSGDLQTQCRLLLAGLELQLQRQRERDHRPEPTDGSRPPLRLFRDDSN